MELSKYIIINDEISTRGKFTIAQTLDTTQEEPRLIIQGQLSMHLYFEEIKRIESERYIVHDVTVVQESFGSDDFNIVYTFLADRLEVKHGYTMFSSEEVKEIENELYGIDVLDKKEEGESDE